MVVGLVMAPAANATLDTFSQTGFDGGSVANIDTYEVVYSDEYVTVPVPGTLWLFGLGLLGLSRRNKAALG